MPCTHILARISRFALSRPPREGRVLDSCTCGLLELVIQENRLSSLHICTQGLYITLQMCV